MKRVHVGIIGLGSVAQIVHLPVLRQLRDRYQIAAICDVSPGLLRAVGDEYGISRRFSDAAELVASPDVDAVFVLSNDEYHAGHAVQAARAGKHVLVEKPMCLTPREVGEIIAARDRAGVQVMVAYMRRFAPALLAAKEALRRLDRVDFVQVRDIIGANRFFIDQTSNIHRFDDIPGGAKADLAQRARDLVTEAIGEVPPEVVTAYRMLLGLGSHDLSAMRELIGAPQRVLAAAQWREGRFVTALFDYGDYRTVFEMGVDQVRRFDAHIEIFGGDRQIRVQYDSPFIRHLPTTLVVRETIGEALQESVLRPTFKDPYTAELEYFHDVVTEGAPLKTTPEDFAADLTLCRQIIDALNASPPTPGAAHAMA